ncbi:hypothetical protein D1F64_19145 [Breoghania sp. L-A4]|nr:hypothetical protein D1F64_19145 [Breoghania sp. L-A4]
MPDLRTLPFPENLGFDDTVRVEVAECLVIGRAELMAARAKIRHALDGDDRPDAETRRWLVKHLTLVENALSAVRQSEI